MRIQMWIAPGPFPPAVVRQHAIIAEAIEVDTKPFKYILPNEVKVL